jgi:hypothetical protein
VGNSRLAVPTATERDQTLVNVIDPSLRMAAWDQHSHSMLGGTQKAGQGASNQKPLSASGFSAIELCIYEQTSFTWGASIQVWPNHATFFELAVMTNLVGWRR